MPDYDALLFVSFGGPEGPNDVLPFLKNVLRGRNVPESRMLEVAEHYHHFGGVSPINAQNRALIEAVEQDFATHGVELPIYFGNRNWHPLLPDTLRQMKDDGVGRALAFVTSAFSSYSGCRQYRENIQAAQQEVGEGAPEIHKLRVFYNHPGFIGAMAEGVRVALAEVPEEARAHTPLVFTAHSIPESMAVGCEYVKQFEAASRLVAEAVGITDWHCVYQSRSGPPHQPWLEPDVCDFLRDWHGQTNHTHVVLVPIGFLSDHMEVLFDLDHEAAELCQELGVSLHRAATAGTAPALVQMIRQLVVERTIEGCERLSLGDAGPNHDVCPEDCCLPGAQPPRPAGAGRPS